MLNHNYLTQTNKQTLTNCQNKLPKIFAIILAVTLSLTLSCAPNFCFANSTATNSSTNTPLFSNTTAIVATAAAGVIGIGAVIGALSSNNSNNSPAAQSFTVTYNLNGGTGISTPVDSTVYPSGASVTVANYAGLAVAGVSVRTLLSDGSSYPCVQWNTKADGSGTSYTSSKTFTITTDTTLYAQYFTSSMLGTSIEGDGIIVYIKPSATPGQRQVLIMAAADQSPGVVWINGSGQDALINALEDNYIGAGSVNTNIMQDGDNTGSANAATVCTTETIGTGRYTDWYLPSKWELNQMYIYASANSTTIPKSGSDSTTGSRGGFLDVIYWSSTENSDRAAWVQVFDTSFQYFASKNYTTLRVRAVRAINY